MKHSRSQKLSRRSASHQSCSALPRRRLVMGELVKLPHLHKQKLLSRPQQASTLMAQSSEESLMQCFGNSEW
eukprot:2522784-Amphidinium_carterae.2